MEITMEILSTLLSGAFTILATLLGFILGLLSGVFVWWWKARGIRHMLADEVEVNWNQYARFKAGDDWPVRSVYIWQSLQPLVPGLLSRRRVKALADFYYLQAQVYKARATNLPLTQEQAEKLRDAAKETLERLGEH
jgi:hypothetical protein